MMSEQYAREYGNGYLQNLATAFLRLDVTIAKKDPRLHPYLLWASSLGGMNTKSLPEECLRSMANCWVFFGDVKPKNVKVGVLEIPHDADTELRKILDAEVGGLELVEE